MGIKMILIRKAFSFFKLLKRELISKYYLFKYQWLSASIDIRQNVKFKSHVHLSATDGGNIRIGCNVSICSNVRIVAQKGTIIIGDNVHIGENSIITSKEHIEIGKDCLIAEYVVIRDQDHSIETRPINRAGFVTSPITIGNDVWLGSKSTILRGSIIGDGAVIGAHSLVNKKIEAYTLAVGTPAKEIKKI
jgi:acetyltransferase-like isoleucine patch superfamily enzyme